jgi:ADP-ribose pyrophosphatase
VTARPELGETRLRGEQVYRGVLLDVWRDVVRLPDGAESVREYIRHPGAVAVVALLDDGRLVLERQFRYPHHRDFLEIPAGKLEPGEARLETAQRELLEETGYAARQWTCLGVIHNAIAYSDEAIELWLARGLDKREARLDAEEFLEVLLLPFDEALAMCSDGRISDVKTIIGLMWAKGRIGQDDGGDHADAT